MRVATGTVISGQVVLDDSEFIEGTQVVVVSREQDDAVRLSQDELAELEAGIAEADRGDLIPGDEFFARLARHG
jgi:predicted transcriptional regulator